MDKVVNEGEAARGNPSLQEAAQPPASAPPDAAGDEAEDGRLSTIEEEGALPMARGSSILSMRTLSTPSLVRKSKS